MRHFKWGVVLALLILLIIETQVASGQEEIGNIVFVKGIVEVVRGEQTLTAQKDMPLSKDDILIAKEGALAEIQLGDKGFLTVRGGTTVKIADLLGSEEPARTLWTQRIWAKVKGVLKKEESGEEVAAGLKAAEGDEVGELEGDFSEDPFEEKPEEEPKVEEAEEVVSLNPPDEEEMKAAIRELERTVRDAS